MNREEWAKTDSVVADRNWACSVNTSSAVRLLTVSCSDGDG